MEIENKSIKAAATETRKTKRSKNFKVDNLSDKCNNTSIELELAYDADLNIALPVNATSVRNIPLYSLKGQGFDPLLPGLFGVFKKAVEDSVSSGQTTLSIATIGCYYNAGLVGFSGFLQVLSGMLKRDIYWTDINKTVIDQFIVYLAESDWSFVTQKVKYTALKSLLKLCFKAGLLQHISEVKNLFSDNPYPNSNKKSTGQSPYSKAEFKRLATAIRNEYTLITQGKERLTAYELGVCVLAVALRTGMNPTPLRKIDFNSVPKGFLGAAKRTAASEILKRNKGSTIVSNFRNLLTFLSYLDSRNIKQPSCIKPLIAMQYVEYQKTRISSQTGKPLAAQSLCLMFLAVENLHKVLAGTFQEFAHPWPESSAAHLAGRSREGRTRKPKTSVIPEVVFAEIFQFANGYLERSEELMKLLSESDSMREQYANQSQSNVIQKLNANVKAKGYSDLSQFNKEIALLESSCWLIIMGTVGVRVHELCEIEKDTYYSKIKDDGRYHFIVSRSLKTDEGMTSWLCPEIAIEALKVMTRLSEPLRAKLSDQIKAEKLAGDHSKAEEFERIQHSCVLGVSRLKNNEIGVFCGRAINQRLNALAKAAGVDWHFASHQFRRTFAHFVVHNQLGDLRYLRDHFKHWSLDMAALYGFDDNLDLELFTDINRTYREKGESIFAHWLDESTPIAGGLKDNVISLRNRGDAVKTYGSREDMIKTVSDNIIIRSTGIAWCTNDTFGCGGGQCEECVHSVIDDSHQYKWEAIYMQQLELRKIAEQVGPGGTATIERTIKRCEKVLAELGADMEKIKEKVAACA